MDPHPQGLRRQVRDPVRGSSVCLALFCIESSHITSLTPALLHPSSQPPQPESARGPSQPDRSSSRSLYLSLSPHTSHHEQITCPLSLSPAPLPSPSTLPHLLLLKQPLHLPPLLHEPPPLFPPPIHPAPQPLQSQRRLHPPHQRIVILRDEERRKQREDRFE